MTAGASHVAGMRRGQVATAAGVNIETLRYYERRGLLAEPDRSLGGHRVYRPEAVTTLRVIKAAPEARVLARRSRRAARAGSPSAHPAG